MHLSDEQKTAINKQIVVDKARDIIAHKQDAIEMGKAAHTIWNALLRTPVWQIAVGEQPKDFKEPEEVWSEPPIVIRK